MSPPSLPPLEPPTLSLGALVLWVHGRQFPEATDYWDANWLEVTARCEGTNSVVHVHGPVLHLPELVRWRRDLSNLHVSLQGRADLVPMEPYLAVHIEAKALGHMKISIEITADHLAERHRFEDGTDQTFIAILLQQLDTLLAAYPLVGSP